MSPTCRRILAALEHAGPRGLTTAQLCQPEAGGVRFSARVMELREAGYEIDDRCVRKGSWRYWLRSTPTLVVDEHPDRPFVIDGFCWACAFNVEHTEHIYGALTIAPDTAIELREAA